MRLLSLVAALLLLAGSVWFFVGGVGPMMRRAMIFDQAALPGIGQWALMLGFLAVWWGGVLCCIVGFRGLYRSIASSFKRPWHAGDWIVLLGHVAALAAVIGLILGILNVRRDFPVYALLMAAAFGYAAGLGVLVLGARRGTAPRN